MNKNIKYMYMHLLQYKALVTNISIENSGTIIVEMLSSIDRSSCNLIVKFSKYGPESISYTFNRKFEQIYELGRATPVEFW